MTNLIKVFVTYRWENQEHQNKVLAFVEFLRKKGFHADYDSSYSQDETAMDFQKMMHKAMTDFDKVIIILSKGYKERAEKFEGGVGNEYSLIIKDIEVSPKKYILASFEPNFDEITPLYFRSREIVYLQETNYNKLFAKLKNEYEIVLSEVAAETPIVEKKIIPDFEVKTQININELSCKITSSLMQGGLFSHIDFELSFEIENLSSDLLDGYNIEVYYPKNCFKKTISYTAKDGYFIVHYLNNPKIFPKQSLTIKIDEIVVTNSNIMNIIEDIIIIKLYTLKGNFEKEYKLSEYLYVKNNYGTKEQMTIDKFRMR